MNITSYIACDLGASSGRVILGTLQDDRLTLREMQRFTNSPLNQKERLCWDVPGILDELKAGLSKVGQEGVAVASVSVNSWGVDYVLLDADGGLLSQPYHYRDRRTDATYRSVIKDLGAKFIFEETGVQFMPLNTLYQLVAEMAEHAHRVDLTDRLLSIADYFNFLFCGVGRMEESIASTTQLYNPRLRTWSVSLLRALRLPARIFPQLVRPGTRLGPLLPRLQAEVGMSGVEVVATCSHDTGAAVLGVPAEGENWAFISSGTWSLIGVELAAPLINDEVLARSFTNESGAGGTTRFLKNIAGMWLLQECQRVWQQRNESFAHEDLANLAEKSEPFRSLINPNADHFCRPGDMPGTIQNFCRDTGQPVPRTLGQIVRCILESLALLYRRSLHELEQLTSLAIRRVHIVGGGSQNALLNQWTASATGRLVLAGPVEATAAGNLLLQAIALGHLDSIQNARRIVRNSFPVRSFEPQGNDEWQRAFEKFELLISQQ